MTTTLADMEAEDLGIEIVDDPASLTAFLKPGCAGAIWRRQVPTDILEWLSALPPEQLPQGRVILPKHKIGAAVSELCDIAELPYGRERVWLETDIGALADIFTSLLSARFLRLRLDVVTTNACRKFHVDAISARMVCTYRGAGTQYGISKGGDDPSEILTTRTGAPILLRGTLWPARPPSGLLHRSPPIEGTGETRLVLVLDPVSDPDIEV